MQCDSLIPEKYFGEPDTSHSVRNIPFGATGPENPSSPEPVTGLKMNTSCFNIKGACIAMVFYHNQFNFITYLDLRVKAIIRSSNIQPVHSSTTSSDLHFEAFPQHSGDSDHSLPHCPALPSSPPESSDPAAEGRMPGACSHRAGSPSGRVCSCQANCKNILDVTSIAVSLLTHLGSCLFHIFMSIKPEFTSFL